ncbi:helix-turn-helix domain-containing protein [Nocardia alba]|uniref:AraC-like DNA-binding protein n=1 Tax=Nocardia alba TaxID=225051 RepID=A0A4R1G3K7_9NOCA|nr:helix-turn-helix domain-containing protein [Nocardia alba]TCK00925.1 AraC-like DNA-binding protein [Nocardia alba]
MAIVFRSDAVPIEDREDATRSAFLEQTWPMSFGLADMTASDSVLEVWRYGSARVLRATFTGLRTSRQNRHIRAAESGMMALMVQDRGTGRHVSAGAQRVVGIDRMALVDLDVAHDVDWDGHGRSITFYFPRAELGLSRAVLDGATSSLAASPLHDLVRTQIRGLAAEGEQSIMSTVAESVGVATVDIVRTLLASTYDARYGRGATTEMLLPRVRAYVRSHLSDPALSADMIAREHGISTRQLVRVCAESELVLEQWIITQRLDGTRAELARPELRQVPISAVARRWGFTNSSYFSRKFRQMYGVTPRTWRQLCAETMNRSR